MEYKQYIMKTHNYVQNKHIPLQFCNEFNISKIKYFLNNSTYISITLEFCLSALYLYTHN